MLVSCNYIGYISNQLLGDFPLFFSTTTTMSWTRYGYFTDTVWLRRTIIKTINRLEMDYYSINDMAQDPNKLTANPCWPSTLGQYVEPGFALFNYDSYYVGQGRAPLSYMVSPSANVTQGLTPIQKRENIACEAQI